MKLKNPPPKNARLTKKFAYEVHAVLKEIEYRIFMSRILERPANGIEFEWRCDIQDRVTAICAHLYSWKENEKRKAQKRKAQNTKGDEEAYNRLNTKSPENVNSEKVIYNGAKMYEALMQIRDSVYIDPDDGKCQSDIDASDLREICDAALDESPRNCDVGTEREQSKRFDSYCFNHRTYERGCGDCPLLSSVCCELAWGQLPYKKGETK